MKRWMMAAAAVLLTSCSGAGSLLGDLRVGWRFENAASCADAKVSFVEVLVTNEDGGVKEFDQAFDCLDDGAIITDLLPGTYTVTLNGLDSGGYTRYQTVAQVEIKPGGTNLGEAVLGYVLGNITFYWTFDGTADCKATGVSTMQIVILDAQQQTIFNENHPCTDRGATITDFLRGDYTLILYGLDVSNARLYEVQMPLPINIGDNQYGAIDLKTSLSTGNATFTWTFDGGKDCVQAGVKTVEIALSAPGGQLIFSDSPSCSGGAYTIPSLQPGYYDLRLTGLDGDSVALYAAGPVRVEVKAGQSNLGGFDLSRL